MFVAAFVAGAAAAVGVNQALDVHLAQRRPQVESEPIFVALRSLAQGSPVTVWDVALRDWPKAMLPTTAMRAEDSFEGCVLRHPLREGQPLLKVQLVHGAGPARTDVVDIPAFAPPAVAEPVARSVEPDLWTPAPAEPTVSTTPTEPVTVADSTLQPNTSADVAPPLGPSTTVDPETLADLTDLAAGLQVPMLAEDLEPQPPLDAEPVAIAAIDEPTLADPLPGEPTPADTPPPADAGVESVVAARSVTTTADPTAAVAVPAPPTEPETAPRQPRDGVVRYLVVPERVAMQADAGFAQPQPAPPTAPPPVATAPSNASASSLPRVREATSAARARSAPTGQPRPTQQAAQPASRGTSRPQANQPPRRQAAPPAPRPPTASTPRGFSGMFPNIAAGLDAMTGRKPRPADSGFDEAVATDEPTVQTR